MSSNLNRLKQDYRDSAAAFSFKDPLPILGRDNIGDRSGKKCALMTLNTSLREGHYTNHLQWDSMRKTPTWCVAEPLGETGGKCVNDSFYSLVARVIRHCVLKESSDVHLSEVAGSADRRPHVTQAIWIDGSSHYLDTEHAHYDDPARLHVTKTSLKVSATLL